MSKFIHRTLVATVAALPLVALVDLAAGQQAPGAQSATQTKELRQQAERGSQQEAPAQPRRAGAPPGQPGQPTLQPAQPGQAQPGQRTQPGLPAQPAQPGQVRQTTEYRASPSQGQINDKTLIDAFLTGPNQAEIALGQLAQQQAQNPEVKQFAERMVRDHTEFLQQLQGIAAAAQPAVAAQGGLLQVIQDVERHCQQSATQELQKHQGAEFDQAYMGIMVMAHGKMLSTFEALRDKASPALQQALAQGADTARQHHQLAHDIKMKLSSEGGAARSAARPAQPTQPQEKRN
jgi:putative membrane protein